MKKHKMLVYIAGALRADVPQYIINVHNMIRWGEIVRREGFIVVIPALDLLQGLIMGDMHFKDYFDNSFGIIERCDAIFVVPGYKNSKGTKKEILHAKVLKIPVFFKVDALIKHYERFFSNPLTTKECYKK